MQYIYERLLVVIKWNVLVTVLKTSFSLTFLQLAGITVLYWWSSQRCIYNDEILKCPWEWTYICPQWWWAHLYFPFSTSKFTIPSAWKKSTGCSKCTLAQLCLIVGPTSHASAQRCYYSNPSLPVSISFHEHASWYNISWTQGQRMRRCPCVQLMLRTPSQSRNCIHAMLANPLWILLPLRRDFCLAFRLGIRSRPASQIHSSLFPIYAPRDLAVPRIPLLLRARVNTRQIGRLRR